MIKLFFIICLKRYSFVKYTLMIPLSPVQMLCIRTKTLKAKLHFLAQHYHSGIGQKEVDVHHP